jgi:uncharacterized protein (TIGR03118 family)
MTGVYRRILLVGLAAAPGLLLGARMALAAEAGTPTAYVRTDLLSNHLTLAQPPDPNLRNAWGVANSPGGPLWVSDNNAGVATLYDGNGVKTNLTVTIPLPPGRPPQPPAAPTGMIRNLTADFVISAGTVSAPASFIFATEDGTIAAWNSMVDPVTGGTSTASLIVDHSSVGAVYKGLAFGTNKHGNFLFATNFASGAVEIYDTNFKLTTLEGSFSDPDMPAFFAPFGIQNIDNNLYVTYAMQNAQKNDVVAGDGFGFVNVFTTDGIFIKRFASRGVLNAPWGVARATQNFGQFSGDILIGNFGNKGNFAGWIDAFSGTTNNRFVGALRNGQGNPISIAGLWSIVFGTFRNSDADTLYFTAGPNNQTNGLFGKVEARPANGLAAK